MGPFSQQETFIHGICVNGKVHRKFTLEEEVMRHTFLVSNDRTLDLDRLTGDEKKRIPPDEAYFQACIMAARLKVEGIDKVTPEQVESLSKSDGHQLMYLSSIIENRRELFRKEIEAAAAGHPDPEKTGLHDGGGPGHEPGADKEL
jgi:hypothetical protein